MSTHLVHELDNGLTVLVEPVAGVRTAALTLLVPAGVVHEPTDQLGLANFVVAMVTRGAGPYSSRELMQRQDTLGLQRSENAETNHSSFTVATVADRLPESLELTAEIVRRPHFPEEQLDLCRAGLLQEIQSLEDDPGQKLFLALRERTLPSPLGRPIVGRAESVEAMTLNSIIDFHRKQYSPAAAILAIAGAVDPLAVIETVKATLGDWSYSGPSTSVIMSPPKVPVYAHFPSDKVQTHLGVTLESVNASDPDYFNAHAAVAVLSGGMSSRLWTEVREKRGLCYSVNASFAPLKNIGVVLAYAATTSEQRAGETLDVMRREIRRLSEGIAEEEVARVRAGLKSSLVMQQESTAARASVLARSWFNLGRLRTVEEIAREIDKLTPASILEYLERRPLREIGIMTLGPEKVEIPA